MKYPEIGRKDYDMQYNEEGECIDGYETREINRKTDPLFMPVYEFCGWPKGPILMTLEHRWSGYSEYTVTNVWTGIVITAPDEGKEWEFEDLGTFLRTIADHTPKSGER
jgi:hypothetical protein